MELGAVMEEVVDEGEGDWVRKGVRRVEMRRWRVRRSRVIFISWEIL